MSSNIYCVYYNLFKLNKTGIYNIAGAPIKSIQEVLDYMLSISKLNKDEIKFIEEPSLMRKIDVDMQIVDCSKFNKEISQNHDYTFEQTMTDILNKWRNEINERE